MGRATGALQIVSLVLLVVGRVMADQAQVLNETDVVFMSGAKDPTYYDAYGATWVAWGRGWAWPADKVFKEMHDRGIHSTGSFWCLTPGAKLVHEDPAMRQAVAVDIEGNPIKVSWLLDHVHEGTPTWFGCTNNPAFKRHLRKKLREVLADYPQGLHIDDPSGTHSPVRYGGGCFCDFCMQAFSTYLQQCDSPELRKQAGVESFKNFDYRSLVKKYATTKKAYFSVVKALPLRQEFLDCQLGLAVENIRQLGELARDILGPAMTLSVNTYYAGPANHFVAFVPAITHMVAEVAHHAARGTKDLLSVVGAYRQAETVERPLAATANGGDYAFVKERGAVNLVKIWVALGYACGQRLMVPHPEHQWCQTAEKGTHWYEAPVKEFAPLYKFVRKSRELFDGFRTVGPLSPPRDVPARFDTQEQRDALKKALAEGDPHPLTAGESVWLFPRAKPAGELVVHLLNIDYHSETDHIRPQRGLIVRIPKGLAARKITKATLYSYDADPVAIQVKRSAQGFSLTIPELRIWSILRFR